MTLYEADWYAWVQEQAVLLEQGRFDALDLEHLVEELELMAGNAPGELYDRLIVLLAHLLKLQVAVELLPGVYDRAQRGWRLTCAEQRRRLARLLRRNPSLRPTVPEEVAAAYEVAQLQAMAALQVDETRLPTQCPWTPDEVLTVDFWPANTTP
jgi:Domain of unknown function DUF29